MEGNQEFDALVCSCGVEPLENQEEGVVKTPGKLGISIFKDEDDESLDRRYS